MTALRAALNEHKALVFRGVRLDDEGQQRFAGYFGHDDLPRRLNRVTVAGDVPAGIDGRPSYSVAGGASHYTPVAGVRAAA